jgi:hypothetical protein
LQPLALDGRSGSLAVRVPTTRPGGRFSGTADGAKAIFVGGAIVVKLKTGDQSPPILLVRAWTCQ